MDEKAKSRTNTQEHISIERLQDSKEYDKSIKVILIGDSYVGKSSIIDRLKSNTFKINQPSTIGLEHHSIIIKINSYILRMQIWDTAGLEKFDSIAATYYKSTEVVLFVYAINLKSSFDRIIDWAKQVDDNKTNDEEQLRILIGNKTDLESKREVSFEEGKALANNIGCSNCIEISCLEKESDVNNNRIESIVEIIGKYFYNLYKLSKSERLNSSSFNYYASDSVKYQKNPKKKCAC